MVADSTTLSHISRPGLAVGPTDLILDYMGAMQADTREPMAVIVKHRSCK